MNKSFYFKEQEFGFALSSLMICSGLNFYFGPDLWDKRGDQQTLLELEILSNKDRESIDDKPFQRVVNFIVPKYFVEGKALYAKKGLIFLPNKPRNGAILPKRS